MSNLPHIDAVLIPQKKIVNYLLSETHEAGRDKANFFKHFGFTSEAWETLAQALRQHAARDSQGRTFTIREQIRD